MALDADDPGKRGKVVLAGGSGFIGSALARALLAQGREVVVLSRTGRAPGGARGVEWDACTLGSWQSELDGAEAVINLAGESISCKWSIEAKRRIVESRTSSAAAVATAISACQDAPRTWLNASAVGVYGNLDAEKVDESSGVGPAGGFLADVCAAWESTVDVALLPSTRKVKLRIGFVLDRQGGALPILARLATCFLGGQAGGGRQGVSWIHLADLVSLALWLLDNDLAGPVNACAPNPVSNRELMSAIRAVLRRPWSPPVPKPALILVGKLFGPDAEITLGGQWVVPNVALKNGFVFRFPELRGALEDLLGSAP